MTASHAPSSVLPQHASRRRGSVLIIVLWIAFGLVSMALYFGHSMLLSARAMDNYVAGVEAEQAIEGAVNYISYVLTNPAPIGTNLTPVGMMPGTNSYLQAAVPVGDASFWLIGRADGDNTTGVPAFGLVDEASKLNLNTATLDMLEALPRMTVDLATSIVNWRTSSSNQVTSGGAGSDYYSRLDPPYYAKNTNFESVEELQLVMGATPDILYGKDLNRNGILDPDESTGNLSASGNNLAGLLDPGILEYVTVYSREPNKRSDGSARVNISTAGTGTNTLTALIRGAFQRQRADAILRAAPEGGGYRSVLQYFVRSGMTAVEFAQVEDALTVTNSAWIQGLINVNTAPAPVLACLPGIGVDKAPALVAYRQAHPDQLTSIAWVAQVLDPASALQAGPHITSKSYQFSADVAALGHHGRGYRRTLFVFDTGDGTARIAYRRDLGRLGWALGNVRQQLLRAKETR